MRAAHLATWLVLGAVLGAAPLTGGAQVVTDQRGPLANTYAGANVGVGNYRYTNPPVATVDNLCPVGSFDCKNKPVGWKLYGGYMIIPYFGLEGSFFTMGEAHFKEDLGGGSTRTAKVGIAGYGLSMVGAVPLGPVNLNGRVGWAATTITRKDDVDGVIVARGDHSRGEPLFGAGIDFRIWRGMILRLDWDRSRATTELGEKFEADLYSAGIGWRF